MDNRLAQGGVELCAEAMMSLRVDVFRVDRLLKTLGPPDGELEGWAFAALESFADHGYQGFQWPTYVDLEIIWAISQVVSMPDVSDAVLERIDAQLDRLPDAKYGLIVDLQALDERWPSELPLDVRLRMLRAYVLLGFSNKGVFDAGFVPPRLGLNPWKGEPEFSIVCAGQAPLSEGETAFVDAWQEVRTLGFNRRREPLLRAYAALS